jgi:hypothetical protein
MSLSKEAITEKFIIVKHVLALEIKADRFSKGYDPRDYKKTAEVISCNQ